MKVSAAPTRLMSHTSYSPSRCVGFGGASPPRILAIASAAGRHDCHRDAVLAMCVTGFGTGRVLVTGGRDAAVKVWK